MDYVSKIQIHSTKFESRLRAPDVKRALVRDALQGFKIYWQSHWGKEFESLDACAEGTAFAFTKKTEERQLRSRMESSDRPVRLDGIRLGLARTAVIIDREMTEFDHFMGDFTRRAYGKDRSRDPEFWPFLPKVWFWPDVDDTRLARELPDAIHGPHLHGLIVLSPVNFEKARSLLLSNYQLDLKGYMGQVGGTIEFEPFDPKERGSVANYLEYAAKGAAFLHQSAYCGELYRAYPNSSGLTYSHPSTPRAERRKKDDSGK